MNIQLRDVVKSDLPLFFKQQQNPVALQMAAFTVEDPQDEIAFHERWTKILSDHQIVAMTILLDGDVAGNIASFPVLQERHISYWIGAEYWGQGVATAALTEFLEGTESRPLYARVARDNPASLRVLEKCGFQLEGYGKAFANARGCEIDEAILKLRQTRKS